MVTELVIFYQLLRFWQAGEEIYLSCGTQVKPPIVKLPIKISTYRYVGALCWAPRLKTLCDWAGLLTGLCGSRRPTAKVCSWIGPQLGSVGSMVGQGPLLGHFSWSRLSCRAQCSGKAIGEPQDLTLLVGLDQ